MLERISNIDRDTFEEYKPILLVCDLQEKFRHAIADFSAVLGTTQKMLAAAAVLRFDVIATTQLASKLGDTCSELLASFASMNVPVYDKSCFTMITPEVENKLGGEKRSCIITGIESHICVTQTALDLLHVGHKVYILADGVSSCNREEVPIALARLRAEGAVVTTSESMLYEIMGDASINEFKDMAKLVKDHKEQTKESLNALCR